MPQNRRGDDFITGKGRNAKQKRVRMRGIVSRAACNGHLASRASRAQSLQVGFSLCNPLRGGEAVPSDGLCSVLRNTSTCLKHAAQVDLTKCKSLRR
jgi:hypothetical protein